MRDPLGASATGSLNSQIHKDLAGTAESGLARFARAGPGVLRIDEQPAHPACTSVQVGVSRNPRSRDSANAGFRCPSGRYATRCLRSHQLARRGRDGRGLSTRDTKLHRDVAIKVLPDLAAADRDRIARFEREAQALASLNHPNIAQIHGVEESTAMLALVMELVEGEDRRLLERCLEKDPKRRLRDIADARLELDAATGERASEMASTPRARRV
jgi:Protein kinase domain